KFAILLVFLLLSLATVECCTNCANIDRPRRRHKRWIFSHSYSREWPGYGGRPSDGYVVVPLPMTSTSSPRPASWP
ncbi:hypothetical protein PMAYCL1PPCAC_33186, partial [Pristionchus mayeri]